MTFKQKSFNKTKMISLKGSNLLTGRPNAIYLKNKYQRELDNACAALVNMVHYIEEESKKLRYSFNKSQGLKHDIAAYETERIGLYNTFNDLLKKETNFETNMWKITQKNIKNNSLKIKQNFKESDVDEIKFNSMMDYIKQYPEYISKSSFKLLYENIIKKEKDIRESKKQYNETVSKYNYYLSLFNKYLKKSEDKILNYYDILKEGKEKLDNSRYRKGIFYKISSEKNKDEVNLNLINHRIEQFKNTLEILKKEFINNKDKSFEEMEY